MAEYIERNAMIERLEVTPLLVENDLQRRGIIDLVKRQAAADVAKVRHGGWVFVDDVNDEDARYYCSLCQAGDVHKKEFNVPYCWMCGACMDGRGENDGNR